ncbi:hypothetical protein CSAL01_00325 [Colletotrichum salicis]|uniref:Uncharacterized protein n=1 Tax=Colletotrichum salicis TaxID=1209931 RepID=A0A135RT73_9PEZI|nr:hypothetical protein CSAL01_00325 [Colletotrichum salicis]
MHDRKSNRLQATPDGSGLPPSSEHDRRVEQPESMLAASHRRMSNWFFPHAPTHSVRRGQTREIDNFQNENARLQEQIHQQDKLLVSCKAAFDQASRRVKELERRLTDSKQAYDAQVMDHQREIRGLKGQICDLEAARFTEKTIANGKKVSDTAILEIWQQMAYNIRAVVTTFLTYCPTREELEKGFQTCQTTAVGMTPFEYDLLANEGMRSAVIENHIWRRILSRIFEDGPLREPTGSWGGMAGSKLLLLCNVLISEFFTSNGLVYQLAYLFGIAAVSRDTLPEFFQWRSEGAAMVEELFGPQEQRLRHLADTEQRGFSVLMPPDKKKDPFVRRSFYRDLLAIMKDAVELQSIFMKSRAFFHIHWLDVANPPDGKATLMYNPDLMEADAWEKTLGMGNSVILNTSPGLTKAGTANGDSYDRVMVCALGSFA